MGLLKLSALSITLCLASVTSADSRPNILLLMAEDLSQRVGAFGDPVAQTPHLDALAQQGVRFSNTFTTAGVCAPSRAAHILGMHQIATGTQHMRSSSRPEGGYRSVPPAYAKAYPELLRAAGYYTYTDSKLDYQFSGPTADSGPFTIWSDQGRDTHWRNREADEPFFGFVNFPVTHESGVFTPLGTWPNSLIHFVMQLMRAFTLPEEQTSGAIMPEQVSLPPYYPDTPTVRADLARHYNNIAKMDAQVGQLLAQLEQDGLADNTVIIWTTDHGDGLPRAKREIYDSGIRVPMIIRWPEALRPAGMVPGSLDTRLISFVDLAPTILSLAGVAAPPELHGRDIVSGAKRQYVYASRDRIDEVPDRQRAVRDAKYKYIRSWYPELPGGHALKFRDNIDMVRELQALYKQGELNAVQRLWFEPPGVERLFNVIDDPYELNDLSRDPDLAPDLARMRQALDSWRDRVGDLSDIPEAELVAQVAPGGKSGITPPPQVSFEEGRLVISSDVEGASIGYQLDGQPWQVYSQPIALPAGTAIRVKAVRYGWEASEEIDFETH